MVDVWAEDRQSRVTLDLENIVWLGKRILRLLNHEEASLSVLVVEAEEIQKLNREYLGRDRPTNVISFPMNEGEAIAGDATYLGDVVLSVDAAIREASECGYTPGEMLLLYLIHGILHLSGYDHEDVEEARAREMEEKQKDLFERLAPSLMKRPVILSEAPD